MTPQERIDAIAAEVQPGLGSRTIEPDKHGRLIGDLCLILSEQDRRITELDSDVDPGAAGAADPGPDEVEARHVGASEVKRSRKNRVADKGKSEP